jgi:periplasmic divalent cation tolerance protein
MTPPPTDNQVWLCYCPCPGDGPDKNSAFELAERIIQHGYAACVNILAATTSVYKWQGQLHRETEIPILCKTSAAQVSALIAYLEEHHPYDVPAISAWPATETHAAFSSWVAENTTQ